MSTVSFKRSASNEEDEQQQSSSSAPFRTGASSSPSPLTSPSGAPSSRKKTRSRGTHKSQNYAFRQYMMEHFVAAIRENNNTFKEVIQANAEEIIRRSDPESFAFLGHAWNYIAQIRMIEDTYGLLHGGDVLTFGSDFSKQLGIPGHVFDDGDDRLEEDSFHNPLVVTDIATKTVRAIAAGGVHSVALSTDGIPYTWGDEGDGALGRTLDPTNNASHATPSPVTHLISNDGKDESRSIVRIAAGNSHTVFLSATGNVYVCGSFRDEKDQNFLSIRGADPKSVVRDDDESVDLRSRPVHVPMPQDKIPFRVAAGGAFCAAVLQQKEDPMDHVIVTWGMGTQGELARSSGMTEPSAEGTYDLVSMYCNEQTKQCDPNIIAKEFLTPKPVIWAEQTLLRRTVLDVSCGFYHLLVVAMERSGSGGPQLFASGHNKDGQLGLGDTVTRHELTHVKALKDENVMKVAAGVYHSLALCVGGRKLFAFGQAGGCQLGLSKEKPAASAYETTPKLVAFPGPREKIILDIGAGEKHSMAISHEGDVYMWGCNVSGQTANVPDEPEIARPKVVKLKPGTTVTRAVGGGNHTMLLVKRIGSSN